MYYFFTQTCNTLANYKEVLQKIESPVAVIWGEDDSFLKWKPQKEEVIADLNISEKIFTCWTPNILFKKNSQSISSNYY